MEIIGNLGQTLVERYQGDKESRGRENVIMRG